MSNFTTNPIHDQIWDRCCLIFEEWTELLEMNWWHLSLTRCDAANDEDPGTAADTDAKWEYRQARIRVYLPAIANHSDDDIESIIVHELVHVLVSPMESLMKEKDTKLSEAAVENVARGLLTTKHTLGKTLGKKAA